MIDPTRLDRATRELAYQMGYGHQPSTHKYEQMRSVVDSLLEIVYPAPVISGDDASIRFAYDDAETIAEFGEFVAIQLFGNAPDKLA